MGDMITDVTTFAQSVFEATELLLRSLMDDRLIIYGIPWWQWVVGGSFLLCLGSILLSKIFR